MFNPNALCRATGNVLPPYFYGWITDALCSTPSHFHPLLTELGNIYISKIMVDSEGLEPSFSTTNYDYTIYENASVRIQNKRQHRTTYFLPDALPIELYHALTPRNNGTRTHNTQVVFVCCNCSSVVLKYFKSVPCWT